MQTNTLPNYLLANRKRLGLSQAELAYLLDEGAGAKVCRHERFQRKPNFADAMAYEAIFRRTASELFSGEYRRIEREVAIRAKSLVARLSGKRDGRTAKKLNALACICRVHA